MSTKLTDRAVRAIKFDPERRIEFADELVPGLRIRAGKNHHSWYFRYNHRATGKKVPLRLGTYPAISLQEAREIAQKHRAQLDRGIDPRQAEAERRAAQNKPDTYTVAALVGEFLENAERCRAPKTVADYRRCLGVLKDSWGTRAAAEIGRGDVIDILDRQSKKGYRAAGHTLSAARAAWSYAVEREKVESSPWVGLKRQSRAYKSRTKERALSDAELRILLGTLPDSGLPPKTQLAIRLMLWSGCRPGEVCGAEWREIHLEESTWEIAAHRMKARRPHMVPMPRQAIDTLKAHRKTLGRGNHRHVIPVQNRLGHIDIAVISKQLRQMFGAGAMSLTTFTCHDLRRTVATGLARLGCPREVIKRVLAHADSDITSVYQRHQYDEAAQEWLQRWADHLESLPAPNVLPIERGSKTA